MLKKAGLDVFDYALEFNNLIKKAILEFNQHDDLAVEECDNIEKIIKDLKVTLTGVVARLTDLSIKPRLYFNNTCAFVCTIEFEFDETYKHKLDELTEMLSDFYPDLLFELTNDCILDIIILWNAGYFPNSPVNRAPYLVSFFKSMPDIYFQKIN